MKSTSVPSRWKRPTLRSSTLLLVLAAFVAWISPASAFGSSSNQKVLLQDVRTLTLHRGRMTTGRRTSPVPQLNCIGGNACGNFEPEVVQCHNAGSDGSDVQWKCEADLPNNIRFGQLDVYCEGYNNPDDPYVLKGSCGLEYKLVYANGYQRQGYSWEDADIGNWVKQAKRRSWMETIYLFTWISVVGFIAISFLKKICQPAHPRDDPPPPYRASHRGGGGGGGGGSGGWGGGSGGSGDNYKPSSSSSSEGYRPGFWSGLGLGLATHLATRNNNRRQNYQDNAGYNYRAPSSSYGSYAGAPATASPSSSSGSSRTATGYGGTKRR
ncbi:Store-operated calcium entry-associated regulatory factor [Podila horticola]|nr:Store-operated calcium entry-associated regulatory factor [Podila horticola]